MTILSSKEGKFYEMPEDLLKKYELPAERANEVLAEFGGEMGAPAGSGPVTIYVTGNGAYIEPSGAAPSAEEGDVEPYRHHHHGGGRGGWGGGPGFGFGWGPYFPGPGFFFPPRRRHRHW